MTILDKIRKEQVRENRHEFNVGDTVKISVKLVEFGQLEQVLLQQLLILLRFTNTLKHL